MKSGGKFSHLEAIRRSLGETVENIGRGGFVEEWKDSGTLPDNSAIFTASNIERSFIQEPLKGMAGGMIDFFGNAADQAEKLAGKNANPLSKAGALVYYVAKDTVIGTGENLGEGLAEMYTAGTSDQLVEGCSRFFGGVAGGAGLMAGGVAGAGVRVPVLTESIGGTGVGSLAVEAVGVSAPAVTGTAGAVIGGAVAHASVANEPVQGSGGGRGGRGSSRAELDWGGHKTQIRVKSNEELVEWANKNAGSLEQPKHPLSGSRSIGELQIRELRRRSREGVDHVGQKIDAAARRKLDEVAERLDKAIKESRPELDHYQYSPGDPRISLKEQLGERTGNELISAAEYELQQRLPGGLDDTRLPYQKALAEELRARKLAFEGEEGSNMLRLADEMDSAIIRAESGPVVRNAVVMDPLEIVKGFNDEALWKEAEGILSPNGMGVGGPEAIAKVLRERAALKTGREARKWNRRAKEVEKRGMELRAQEAQRAAESEAAFRGREIPSTIQYLPIAELNPEALRLFFDSFTDPRSTIYSPYTREALLEELTRRGLKP